MLAVIDPAIPTIIVAAITVFGGGYITLLLKRAEVGGKDVGAKLDKMAEDNAKDHARVREAIGHLRDDVGALTGMLEEHARDPWGHPRLVDGKHPAFPPGQALQGDQRSEDRPRSPAHS